MRTRPHWLGIAAGASALAISGLFGGLNEVQADGPPTVAPGEVNSGTPWNVSVVSAQYTKDASPLTLRKPGDRWLMVRATVEVTSDESRSDIRDVLRLRGGRLALRAHGVARPATERTGARRTEVR